MAATDRLTPEPRRFAIRLPRPVMAILFLSFTIPAGVVTAQDAGKKSDSIQSRPAIVVPKDLSEWRLSLNLGVVGPDRDETGWYEIAVDSDRRCRVLRVRRFPGIDRKEFVMFDEKLSEEELATILEQACAAVSSGPPKRKHRFESNGWKVAVTLTAAGKKFAVDVNGLSPLLEDAGEEIQTVVKLINGHLTGTRIWTAAQEELVPGPSQIVPNDLSEWQLSINLGPWGPERNRVGWYEVAIDHDRRCRVVIVRSRKETVLFDGKLSEKELTSVLEHACSAVSDGPPKRKHGYWDDGHRINLSLTTPKKRFKFDVKGLSPLLEDAGPEVQKLLKIINGRLPRVERIWSVQQEKLVP